MIFRKINTNKRTITYSVPTEWSDVTFDKWATLQSEKDISLKYALLTGLDVETVKQPIVYASIDQDVLRLYQKELKDFVPSCVVVDGKELKYPKDITLESIAQYEDSKKCIELHGDKAMSLVVAIYLTSPYDYNKAEELSKSLGSKSCEEIMGLAGFFLNKLNEKPSGIRIILHRLMKRIKTLWKGLVMTSSIKIGAFMLTCMNWLTEIC